jgi:hypothetical protein
MLGLHAEAAGPAGHWLVFHFQARLQRAVRKYGLGAALVIELDMAVIVVACLELQGLETGQRRIEQAVDVVARLVQVDLGAFAAGNAIFLLQRADRGAEVAALANIRGAGAQRVLAQRRIRHGVAVWRIWHMVVLGVAAAAIEVQRDLAGRGIPREGNGAAAVDVAVTRFDDAARLVVVFGRDALVDDVDQAANGP